MILLTIFLLKNLTSFLAEDESTYGDKDDEDGDDESPDVRDT